ncbi:hypothetical protein CLV98_11822 [Dyadobacter jejuensis]|uniref:Uncharacterized protein n=1 Tax=Dyadobacter jejuensis TaxID=1082580 RepID=A0A316AB66_9BACT|nr:hypothetical protein [Dyadobacter jejuensis]PWJ54260.1 hypothetical protein CLV98_11822 [Dyadobacter jejuensis]
MTKVNTGQWSVDIKLKGLGDSTNALEGISREAAFKDIFIPPPSESSVEGLGPKDLHITPSKLNFKVSTPHSAIKKADLGDIIKKIIDLLTKQMQEQGLDASAIEVKLSKEVRAGLVKSLKTVVNSSTPFDIQEFLKEM